MPSSVTLPASGSMRAGVVYALPTWVLRTGGSGGSALLPTPAVNDMGRGKTVEQWDSWTETMRDRHGNGNGHGASLEIEAQRLLPTPTAQDSSGSRGHRPDGTKYSQTSGVTLTDAVTLLPTPRATRGGSATETLDLLPTPSVADGTGGHLSRSGSRSDELLLPGVAKQIGASTPSPSDAGKASSADPHPTLWTDEDD